LSDESCQFRLSITVLVQTKAFNVAVAGDTLVFGAALHFFNFHFLENEKEEKEQKKKKKIQILYSKINNSNLLPLQFNSIGRSF